MLQYIIDTSNMTSTNPDSYGNYNADTNPSLYGTSPYGTSSNGPSSNGPSSNGPSPNEPILNGPTFRNGDGTVEYCGFAYGN